MRARRAVICISDLHQNDTCIGCLVARHTTDHWAHATGPWPGCDMTGRDFSYKEENAVCVQLAPPQSYTPLASPSSSPPPLTAAVINASILVVLSGPWAGPSPAWLHPKISWYRDTVAYDIAIHFFLTIRALHVMMMMMVELLCDCKLFVISKAFGWCVSDKLHSINPLLGYFSVSHLSRHDSVIFCRPCIRHSSLTRLYLLSRENQPLCTFCDCTFFSVRLIIFLGVFWIVVRVS